MTKNSNTETLELKISIPTQYVEFYQRLQDLGCDIGSLELIASGGIVCYLNCVLDELRAGNSVGYAEPEILTDLSLSQ